jgi:hypothetical protein
MSQDLFYEAGSVTMTWSGIDLSQGKGGDTFLLIEPNSPRVNVKVGNDGSYAFSKMADKGCKITLTCQQTSPVNDEIARVYAAQDIVGAILPVAPFTVVDPVGKSTNFVALNAVLTEMPSNEFGAEAGEKTYVWMASQYLSSDDPSTITSALKAYRP